MRTWLFAGAAIVSVILTTTQARGDDDSDYVWQSDQGVRQTVAVQNAYRSNLTRALVADMDPVPLAPKTLPSAPEAVAPSASPAPLPPKPANPSPAKPAAQRSGVSQQDETLVTPPPPPPPQAPRNTSAPSDVVGANAGVCDGPSCEPEEWRLFECQSLKCHRIDIRGWLDVGGTWNPSSPANRFNGPVAYNDRSNEYQLNQLYMLAERVTETKGCGWDLGGRIDLLYGTDWRFPQAFGLDNEWNQGRRFYGLAMPQVYADVAFDDLVVRMGHILAPCGYESVMAPGNFFYSHSYTFLYGQPTTLTGAQAMYKLNDRLSVNGGFDTGWNDWDAKNGKLGYYFGSNWTSVDEKTTVAFEMFLGNEQPRGIESTRTHYALVLTHKFNDKLSYAVEHNFGDDPRAATQMGVRHAEWGSLVNYLFYQLNDCWTLGGRYEFLVDDDGAIVNGLGNPHGIPLLAVPATWNELSLGANYKPNKNLVFRSEVRWDWVDLRADVSDRPFDDFRKSQQFLWASDMIVRF